MTATIHFRSSDAFMEDDPRACEHALVEAIEYVEATYDQLRTGPDGEVIACFIEGVWVLADGRRFSDWAVKVGR